MKDRRRRPSGLRRLTDFGYTKERNVDVKYKVFGESCFLKPRLSISSTITLFPLVIMWKIYALLSALFAALTAIFAKIGVKDIDSNLATAIRTTVILFLTWGIVAVSGHFSEVRTISKYTWVFLILSGLATGLSWLFYFKALQLGYVSRVQPIDKLSVVFTILLAFLILKEPLSPKVIVGGLLITAGAMVMIWK